MLLISQAPNICLLGRQSEFTFQFWNSIILIQIFISVLLTIWERIKILGHIIGVKIWACPNYVISHFLSTSKSAVLFIPLTVFYCHHLNNSLPFKWKLNLPWAPNLTRQNRFPSLSNRAVWPRLSSIISNQVIQSLPSFTLLDYLKWRQQFTNCQCYFF